MNAEPRTEVPEYKKKLVSDLLDKINENKTVLIASIKNLPGSQFQLIKKKLRGIAEVKVAKKTAINRAIDSSEKQGISDLKEQITSDFVVLFSNSDTFQLSGTLTDNESPAKAKAGDIAPEDITIEPGPTDLIPGPAISELSGVGLKVAVENGKLAIKEKATIVKAGAEINDKVASVLGKLNISPMKVGLLPLAAYDSESGKTYVGIKIDKEGTLEELRTSITKSLSFAINLGYPSKDTIGYIIGKAGIEEKAIENLIGKTENVEEKSAESSEPQTTSENQTENSQEESAQQDDKAEKEEA